MCVCSNIFMLKCVCVKLCVCIKCVAVFMFNLVCVLIFKGVFLSHCLKLWLCVQFFSSSGSTGDFDLDSLDTVSSPAWSSEHRQVNVTPVWSDRPFLSSCSLTQPRKPAKGTQVTPPLRWESTLHGRRHGNTVVCLQGNSWCSTPSHLSRYPRRWVWRTASPTCRPSWSWRRGRSSAPTRRRTTRPMSCWTTASWTRTSDPVRTVRINSNSGSDVDDRLVQRSRFYHTDVIDRY